MLQRLLNLKIILTRLKQKYLFSTTSIKHERFRVLCHRIPNNHLRGDPGKILAFRTYFHQFRLSYRGHLVVLDVQYRLVSKVPYKMMPNPQAEWSIPNSSPMLINLYPRDHICVNANIWMVIFSPKSSCALLETYLNYSPPPTEIFSFPKKVLSRILRIVSHWIKAALGLGWYLLRHLKHIFQDICHMDKFSY